MKSCDIILGNGGGMSLRALIARAFFSSFPLILIFVTVSLGFYRIRHPAGGFLSLLVYILLCAFTWLFLYPSFIGYKSIHTNFDVEEKARPLTKGYFRPVGNSSNSAVYFSSELEDAANLPIIKNDAQGEHAISFQEVKRTSLFEESSPFQDTVIRSSVAMFPEWIVAGYNLLTSLSERALEKSFLHYLGRISWALSLCAMYAFTFCTSWRLLGVLYLLIMDAGVLSFNILYHSAYFSKFRNACSGVLSRFDFLSHFDDGVIFCLNVLVILVSCLIGLLAVLSGRKREGL